MPHPYRREKDVDPEDPREQTLSRKVKRVAQSNEFDWVIKLVMAAVVAGGSGYASHRVSDASDDAAIEKGYSRVAALEQRLGELEAELADTRSKLYKRISAEEAEREAKEERLKELLDYMRGSLGLPSPAERK